VNNSQKAAPSQEDPLMHLLHTPVQKFAKGQTIYDSQHPSDHLYAVVGGRVKVTMTADDGGEAIARWVRADGFFGESCLAGNRPQDEAAEALDDVTVMAWTSAEVEKQVERHPLLGMALSQYLVAQCMGLQDRMFDVVVYKLPERIMLGLARLAKDLGTPMNDGARRVPPLTHYAIAAYVGTSREVVTSNMSHLRKIGIMKYSRKYIDIYLPALLDELQKRGVNLSHIGGERQEAAFTEATMTQRQG
jgi:CRP/FNR family cyclic AMP-dependent transcriptional regulator